MKKRFSNWLHSGYFLYLAVGLLGIWLLTRWWLPPGFILAGHDSGLALDAKDFLFTRFFAWDSSIDFGRDNAQHFGSLTIHTFDYLLSLLAGSGSAGSQVAVFFWLSLIFISGFILAYQFREKIGATFVFLFPVMVTFNFYIGQSLFVLERAKYGLFAATMLFLAIVFRVLDRRESILFSAIVTSLIFFIFNGGSWLGLPLYGGLFVVVLVVLIFTLIENWKKHDFGPLKRLVSFFGLTLIGLILLSSYSIWPYLANFIAGDYEQLLGQVAIRQNKDWLDSVSQGSTFLNLFRLQGVPDWYGGSSQLINVAHIYAADYLQNKLLVIASFFFPLLAFTSFLLAKTRRQRRYVSFFGLLLLVSMFFTAGTRSPLGSLYGFIYDYLPGFAVFRSPYYKFGGSLVMAASFLIAFSASRIGAKIKVGSWLRQVSTGGFVLLFLSLWLGFHFVFFDQNKIFEWQKGFSTKLSVPDYVTEFKTWIDDQKLSGTRILLLPPFNDGWRSDGYEWGYWSLSTLPSALIRSSVVANDHSLVSEERQWVNGLYKSLEAGDEQQFIDLSSRTRVGLVLLRTDVLSGKIWSGTSAPSGFEQTLNSFKRVKKVKEFGRWMLYKVDQEPVPKVIVSSSLISLPADSSYVAREFLQDDHFTLSNINLKRLNIAPFYSSFVSLYECQSCLLEQKSASPSLIPVRIFPNSPFYSVKVSREKAVLNEADNDSEKVDAYLGFILRRYSEVKSMLDLGIEEQYIVDNLKTINLYFDKTSSLVRSFSNPDSDFFRARHILDNVSPIQLYFRKYIDLREFGLKGEALRREIFGVLWRIADLKRFYEPMLSKVDTWSSQKIYFLRFPEKGEYGVFIRTVSLPADIDGNFMAPYHAVYKVGATEKTLEFKQGQDGWLAASITADMPFDAQLILYFDPRPNLFRVEGNSFELFPQGERACYFGTIQNFNKARQYRVEVSTTRKDQSLRLFFRNPDNQELSQQRDKFFYGDDDEADVYPLFTYEPFRYVYYPSGRAVNPRIYLCSGDKELPSITDVGSYEVFSPQVVVTQKVDNAHLTVPVVSFDQRNPTQYTGSVKEVKGPFVLLFNERYSPLWRIYKDDSSQEPFSRLINRVKDDKQIGQHFTIDGYANAWLIEKNEDFNFSIEYLPQTLFELGRWITLLSLAVFLFVLLSGGISRKRSVGDKA